MGEALTGGQQAVIRKGEGFSLENAYGVEQAQVIKNTEGSNVAIVKGEMVMTLQGS
jgi:hypothetical protein